MTSAVQRALAVVVGGAVLDAESMRAAMESILSGEASDAEIAGLAIALRMRGEQRVEIATAARVLREHMVRPKVDPELRTLDTCGTGGDASGTFNVSTVAALVIAACGVPVAKHGNRAVSSRSGSADVLEALGVSIDPGPERVASHLTELGIAFLFAPQYHGALKHAARVRRALGVRTFFNLLGPLANPAGARLQLLGVYDRSRVRLVAEVLSDLGVERAWVVHGEVSGGLDEISPCGPTMVARLADGRIESDVITPETFGLDPVPLEALAGGDAERNAGITREILGGAPGAPRTAVVLNAAAGLMVSGMDHPHDARARAEEAIDSGRALALLERWRSA